MRLVLAMAALAALLVALLGGAQAPAAENARNTASLMPHVAALALAAEPVPVPAAAMPPIAAASHASAPLYTVEAAVRAARQGGADENEIHRLRASQLPAAQLESLVAMEMAEASWLRRVAELRRQCGLGAACGTHLTPEEHARLRSYDRPTLRQ